LAAAGFSGLPPSSAAEPAADIHLGVATYSLREFQRGLAIRMLRQLGISHASVKEFHLPYLLPPEELKRAAEQFRRAGIAIESGGVIYLREDSDEDMRKYFDYARACAMPMMVVGATLENVPRIEKFVKAYDIRIAIHNHGPEDKQFPTPDVALKALRGRDARMGVCVDVGHTARASADPVESIRSAGARLFDVHIKDLRDLKDARTQVPVGEGAMPVGAIFKELLRMNYRASVNLEYEIDGDDPLPGMAKSFAYMRGVLAGLRG
jgi:sugar phosphate isomerase/epimerase